MQLITHQNHIDQLLSSNLKDYIQQRFNQLYEDCDFEIPPILLLVEADDYVTCSDFAFVGTNGLLSDYFNKHDIHHPDYTRPYEWVSYYPGLKLYEAVHLQFVDFGYWILIPESVVDDHPDLHHVLTSPALGGLSDPPPL